MVEVTLVKMIIDEKKGEQVIVLKEKNGKKFFPIIIGISEASAIKLKLSGIQPPRPLTHDLLKNIIDKLGTKLEKIVIDNLEKNTFYAKLILKTNDGNIISVDARPSDSIALALRAEAPIFVEEEVFSKVGAGDELST